MMRSRDIGRRWGMAATLLALVATGAAGHVGAVASGGGALAMGAATATPIKHLVVIFQENG